MTELAQPNPMAAVNARARDVFRSDVTRPHAFRVEQLRKLKEALERFEPKILAAMQADVGRSPVEAYAGEIGVVVKDLNLALRKLGSWMKPRRVPTNLMLLPASSEILPEPLGVALILAPWNYPVNLFLGPLVGAISAGCTAVLKPSELSPETAKVMEELLHATFPDDGFVRVVQGGPSVAEQLLELKWDLIFFTGSTRVGKHVMAAASKYLTPCVLELGGKNATLVDEDVDLDVTARRIVWGRFFNAGQSCLAPDYVLVHKAVKEPLVEKLVSTIKDFYGEDPKKSPYLGRIVNAHHVRRLKGLLTTGKVVVGGDCDEAERYFAPTVVVDPAMDTPLMQDEIFGPILPVVGVDAWSQAVRIARDHSRPLALYAFTRNQAHIDEVAARTSSGSLMVNDTVLQFVNESTPFGGVGDSGTGNYHGKFSFEAFSHFKPVIRKSFLFDAAFRYPSKLGSMGLFKWLLR